MHRTDGYSGPVKVAGIFKDLMNARKLSVKTERRLHEELLLGTFMNVSHLMCMHAKLGIKAAKTSKQGNICEVQC